MPDTILRLLRQLANNMLVGTDREVEDCAMRLSQVFLGAVLMGRILSDVEGGIPREEAVRRADSALWQFNKELLDNVIKSLDAVARAVEMSPVNGPGGDA